MALNRTTDAMPELALATRLAPKSASFHLDLARAYQKAGDKALAAKEIAAFNQLESKKLLPANPRLSSRFASMKGPRSQSRRPGVRPRREYAAP